MKDYKFCLDFKVRDYECDMEGIVNNATYMNYLEHARHEFLHTIYRHRFRRDDRARHNHGCDPCGA